METKFNFNSAICISRSQSERLLALGLKKETADIRGVEGIEHTPTYAWSLHRLIEMMPKCVRAHSSGDDSPRLHPYVPKFDYRGVTIENIDEVLDEFYAHADLFNNICDAIEWLIKEEYFNKEYLV